MIEEEFVRYIVSNLIEHPDDIEIKRTDDKRGTLLELSVNPDDLGRLIGHKGSTVQAIRSVLRALGIKNGQRYTLKVVNTDKQLASEKDDSDKENAPVENPTTETVENPDTGLKKLRDDLADLRESEL